MTGALRLCCDVSHEHTIVKAAVPESDIAQITMITQIISNESYHKYVAKKIVLCNNLHIVRFI